MALTDEIRNKFEKQQGVSLKEISNNPESIPKMFHAPEKYEKPLYNTNDSQDADYSNMQILKDW